MRKFLITGILGLCLASGVAAQDTVLPFRPKTNVSVQITDGTKKWNQSLVVPHKTVDKSFVAWSAISQAATLADDFNTIYALQRPGTREANPLLRSRAALFGVTEGLFVVDEIMAWRYKREDDALKYAGIPGHKYSKWWVVPMLNVGAHGLGVGLTLKFTGR